MRMCGPTPALHHGVFAVTATVQLGQKRIRVVNDFSHAHLQKRGDKVEMLKKIWFAWASAARVLRVNVVCAGRLNAYAV